MMLNDRLWYDILDWIEANPNIDSEKINIPGHGNDQIAYHVDMIAQEHPPLVTFVYPYHNKKNAFPGYLGLRLTRYGHDVLAAYRESM
jgi:hypothetical protein